MNAWLLQSEGHLEEYRMAEPWLAELRKPTPYSLPELDGLL